MDDILGSQQVREKLDLNTLKFLKRLALRHSKEAESEVARWGGIQDAHDRQVEHLDFLINAEETDKQMKEQAHTLEELI